MPDRASENQIKCSLLWKLGRAHGWGTPVRKEDLVTLALDDVEQGRGKQIVDELIEESYVTYRKGYGFQVKNDPDAQAKAAFRLEETCGYTRLQIEATFSRFEQAGGFDAYQAEDVYDDFDERW